MNKNTQINSDVNNGKKDLKAPEDKYNIIYILFFFLGLSHLLPRTFVSTATKYWMYKFRNTSIDDTNSEFRTWLQADFNATMLIILQITGVASLIVGLLFGTMIRLRVRLIGTLVTTVVLFSIFTAFVKINTDSWQEGFFALVLVLVAFINSVVSVLALALLTAVSHFPHHYLAPFITGGGLSRICTSILQLISLATNLSVLDSALVYFLMGVFILTFTLVFTIVATGYNDFYLYHIKNVQVEKRETRVSFKEGKVLSKKIWSCIVMMSLCLLQMEAAPTALVVSENEGSGVWNDVYFVPVITFFTSSVCDIIGKWISFKFTPNLPGWAWVLFTFIKVAIFIPLFTLCNAQPRKHLPVLLPHDYQYITLIVVSSIVTSYIMSQSIYNIASLVTKEELKNAYHVHMILISVITAMLSFVGIVNVNLL